MSDKQVLVQTTQHFYEHMDTFSDMLKVGNEMYVVGLHVSIEKIRINDHDEMVLDLDITGATVKKRSKMMLIVPKKVPITILIEKNEPVTSER
jgi:hypothetical protein